MKKTFLFIVLAFLLVTLVFAKGSKEQKSEIDLELEAASDITLVIWSDETRSALLEELGQQFTEKYGVNVQVQQMGFGDIRDNIKIAAPAGEGPDVIVGAHDWIGELITSGIIAPIDLGRKKDSFTEASIHAFTWNGEVYGMPYAVENLAFIYNPDLVPTVPKTWEEVMSVSASLESSGKAKYGFIRQDGDPYHFFPIQTSYGGYVFAVNADGTYNPDKVGIDDEGSIRAAQWLEKMVNDGLMPAGLDWDTYHALFESGDAAMIITGPWAIERLDASGVNYKIAKIPAGGKPFLGVQGFMVSAFSENPALSAAFLTEFVAQTEPMLTLYEKGGRPPAYIDALNMVDDPALAAFGEAGKDGLPMPAIPEMSAVWAAWEDAIKLIMLKELTAEEAFTNAAKQIRQAIAGN